jgi:nitrite reductase (NADH) small subunit
MSALRHETSFIESTESEIITIHVIYNLGLIQRIPLGEGRTFRVRDTLVAIFRARDGQVYATQPDCPHRGGPLIDGLVGSGKVICPLHNFAFNLATGEPIENACQRLRSYPVSLNEADEILLSLDI